MNLGIIGIAVLVVLGLIGGAELDGMRRGKARQQAADAIVSVKQLADQQTALQAQRDAALDLATEYESQRHDLEVLNAKRIPVRRAALARPAVCPASGAVGDIVLPADLVRSVLVDDAPGPAAPGPAASEPGAGVRVGPVGAGR